MRVVAWLGLVACANGGKDPEPMESTLSGHVQPIFARHCASSGCHGEPELETGLELTDGKSHQNLVSVPSFQVPEMVRVVPGNAEASYLLVKMRGEAEDGDLMPPGFAPLAANELDLIAAWIDAGALDD